MNRNLIKTKLIIINNIFSHLKIYHMHLLVNFELFIEHYYEFIYSQYVAQFGGKQQHLFVMSKILLDI